MRFKILFLLLIDAFNPVKPELRHHQDWFPKASKAGYPRYPTVGYRPENGKLNGVKGLDRLDGKDYPRYPTPDRNPEDGKLAEENALEPPDESGYPRYPTAGHKPEDGKLADVNSLKRPDGSAFPDGSINSFASPSTLSKIFNKVRVSHPTKAAPEPRQNEQEPKKMVKVVRFMKRENKGSERPNKFLGVETATKSITPEKSSVRVSKPQSKKVIRNVPAIANSGIKNSKTPDQSEKTNLESPEPKERTLLSLGGDGGGGRRVAPAESQVDFADSLEGNGCVENVIEDFAVTDDLVSQKALNDSTSAVEMIEALLDGNDSLDGMMEAIMEKHPRITSMSATALNRAQRSKTSQTVYRKKSKLFVDRQPGQYPNFLKDMKSAWTPLFKNCLSESWIFGYSFFVEKGNLRIDAIVYFDMNEISGTVDQCMASFRDVLNGGPKCDPVTTECAPQSDAGLTVGGYKCVCKEGFYIPKDFESSDQFFSGVDVEANPPTNETSLLKCVPCPEVCGGSCTLSGDCIYHRNQFLTKSILAIQVICMLTVYVLTVVVFINRKCKTIASGMWSILEMVLLGSVFMYGTVVVRTVEPSFPLCLIEVWSREMGFVFSYGAITMKLHRILMEFRTRKAHRCLIRDKDILKYLFGMLIIMLCYMSSWTAMNLYLIMNENYSMLTTIVTAGGHQFKACKSVWWDYVTQGCEILLLVFGIHLSYASRNATTQYHERYFLSLAISIEAFVSTVFYILRFFYWNAPIHPDVHLLISFIRCHLSTTVVLLLLFVPKWWYQRLENQKSKLSRQLTSQESCREVELEGYRSQDIATTSNSDADAEISLSDMNPEDIRTELKRLYTQLEVLKNRTIRCDNPHISKRRGGRKLTHRRFSLQALRQQSLRLSIRNTDSGEDGEAGGSRTPEGSMRSNEGPTDILDEDIINILGEDAIEIFGEEVIDMLGEDAIEILSEEVMSLLTEHAVDLFDEDPIDILDEDPINVVNEDPINVVNEDPINVVNEDPINVVNEDPINVVNDDPINVVNDDPINDDPINDDPINDDPINDDPINDDPINVVNDDPLPCDTSDDTQMSPRGAEY